MAITQEDLVKRETAKGDLEPLSKAFADHAHALSEQMVKILHDALENERVTFVTTQSCIDSNQRFIDFVDSSNKYTSHLQSSVDDLHRELKSLENENSRLNNELLHLQEINAAKADGSTSIQCKTQEIILDRQNKLIGQIGEDPYRRKMRIFKLESKIVKAQFKRAELYADETLLWSNKAPSVEILEKSIARMQEYLTVLLAEDDRNDSDDTLY